MTANKAEPNQVRQIAGLLMLVIIGLVYFFRFREAPKIKGDIGTTTAVVTLIGAKGMRGLDEPTTFRYEINGKEYEASFLVPLPCSASSEMSKHSYQVAYNKENPKEARLLISSAMFEQYKVPLDEQAKAFYDKYWDCK